MSTATLEQPVNIDDLPLVPVVPKHQKPLLRFELLFGRHEERNPRWRPNHKRKDSATGVMIPVMLDADGNEVPENILYVYVRGRTTIIETTVDLIRAIDHNSGPNGAKKFRRLNPGEFQEPVAAAPQAVAQTQAAEPPTVPEAKWTAEKLNPKSIRELQLICAESKIPYDNGASKGQLIALLTGAK